MSLYKSTDSFKEKYDSMGYEVLEHTVHFCEMFKVNKSNNEVILVLYENDANFVIHNTYSKDQLSYLLQRLS